MDIDSNATIALSASGSTTNTRKRKFEVDFCFDISVLPSEILVHIFSMVVYNILGIELWYFKEVIAVSLVCKQWNLLCLEPSVWEHYPIFLDEKDFPQKVKKLLDPRFSRVSQLNFYGGRFFSSCHYTHLIFEMQECLVCTSMFAQFSESQRFNVAQITDSITKLIFCHYHINESFFQGVRKLSKLNDLSISMSTFDPTASFQVFQCIAKLTTLKRLCLHFDFKDMAKNNDCLSHLTKLINLETFDLAYLPQHEYGNIFQLTKLPKLSVLKLYYLRNLDREFFEGLSALSQLHTLFLEYQNFDEEKFDFSHTLSQPLPELTHLTIEATIPAKQFISFLTPFLPKLESINVESEDAVKKEHILEMVLLSPYVRTVELNCEGVTPVDLDDLRKMFGGKVTFKNISYQNQSN
eukprot:TRINITY_DN4654_c0_g1_i1.p1 TRINITY_DN4654_c0_g1~~TRINITY_DN4654_c0_g1_i1.p1  ORF type:complete len:409 (+),score=44.08 TRINITY_DN4654_c0_g1_i1:532-1758(+)